MAGLWSDRIAAIGLPGGSPRQPGAGRPPHRPAQPVTRAISRAAEVDRIENELNDKVCSGSLSLAEAQRTEANLKHLHGCERPPGHLRSVLGPSLGHRRARWHRARRLAGHVVVPRPADRRRSITGGLQRRCLGRCSFDQHPAWYTSGRPSCSSQPHGVSMALLADGDRPARRHRPRPPQGRGPRSGAGVLLRRARVRAPAAIRDAGRVHLGGRISPPHRPEHVGKPSAARRRRRQATGLYHVAIAIPIAGRSPTPCGA